MSTIKSLAILGTDGKFGTPIPLSVDLNNVEISSSLKAILDEKGITVSDENIEAVIEALVTLTSDLGETVEVTRGGTGKTSITKGTVLIGGANNTFEERAFDNTLRPNSNNLVSSGTVYNAMANTAPKNHSAATSVYGLGDTTNFGHLKLGEGYKEKTVEDGVAAAHNTLVDMYMSLSGKVNSKIVTDENGNMNITYADNTYEEITFSSTLITDILYADSTKAEILESTNVTFNIDGSIEIEEA